MATPYLAITDNTTSVVIANGSAITNYMLESGKWAPVNTTLRTSPFNGVGTHADVTEEIALHIRGASASAAYANLDTLARLLEQAERWSAGDAVNPVFLKYAPPGATVSSDASPLQAIILGRAEGDETSGVGLPVEFDEASYSFQITDVRVRLIRRGMWLGVTENATGIAQATGVVWATTFPSAPLNPSPVNATISGINDTTLGDFPSAYAIFANRAEALTPAVYTVEAETKTAADYTSVADAANQASGGSVLRYTPTTTNYTPTDYILLNNFATKYPILHIFATVRNNSVTTTWNIRASVATFGRQTTTTTPVTISAASNYPQVVYLGHVTLARMTLAGGFPYDYCRIETQASAVSGTLDIDKLFFISCDQRSAAIIALSATNAVSGQIQNLYAAHNMLTLPNPTIYYNGELGGLYPAIYQGNPLITAYSQYMDVVYITTLGQYWILRGAIANITPTLTLTRSKAYITPQ